MDIKEPSDGLSPTVDSAGQVPQTRVRRTVKEYLALAIATCGVGYLPLAPGTWGSLVGVFLFLGLRNLFLNLVFTWKTLGVAVDSLYAHYYNVLALELLVAVLITLIGIWAASCTERLSGKKDPRKVVIDEVAGQYIALIALPFTMPAFPMLVLAFILFRFFDIVKPYPARKLESLHGGLGIMADDLIAGVYAAIAVALVVAIRSFM